MHIYDVQNTQYALSVLDEIDKTTTKRIPIFKFNNDFIKGDFLIEDAQYGKLPRSHYSVCKKNCSEIISKTHGFDTDTSADDSHQLVKVRHAIFDNIPKEAFLNSPLLPNKDLEINFTKYIVSSINKELTPQNELLIAKNVKFLIAKLNFDIYQFTESDMFELVSIEYVNQED